MSEQRSPEWFQKRLGKVTASRLADVCAKTKTGWSASRANYMAQLAAERLTGQNAGRVFESAEMRWGAETEPEARDAYAWRSNCDVAECDFFDHPNISMSGASPDGLVGADGLIEIKCPNTATHIDTLLGGEVPDKYVKQMLWQMECTGRKWCDFVSYDPRMPDDLKVFVRRFERDETNIEFLRRTVRGFLAETDAMVAALTKLRMAA